MLTPEVWRHREKAGTGTSPGWRWQADLDRTKRREAGRESRRGITN